VNGRDATATSSTADARTSSTADAASGLDASGAGRDALPGDALAIPNDSGSSSGDGGALGPSCTTLTTCCGELPVGGPMCLTVADMGDEAACQMRLEQARGLGLCVDPTADAAAQVDGNSNLSPECAALQPCCAQAGQLATICDNLVNRNDPMRCQQTLDLLAGRGIMCAPAGDAGGGVDPDASESLDATTSSVADAG